MIAAIIISAILLGIKEIANKHAVAKNGAMQVLFLGTLCGSIFYVLMSLCLNGTAAAHCTSKEFALVFLKSCIVAASWVCVFLAMRDMPISLAAPIRATSPLWTLIGGIILYAELPGPWQIVGMAFIFIGYYLFSVCGKKEGFKINGKSMIFILAGTIIGSGSALYDKYILNVLALDRVMVQFYFSVDLIPILAVVALIFYKGETLQWRWTIPVFGILLILADWFYFYAISRPDAQISILSLMRRSNVIISFTGGYLVFKDRNFRQKVFALAMILVGTVILAIF